jgi:RHS repeat-associated protein
MENLESNNFFNQSSLFTANNISSLGAESSPFQALFILNNRQSFSSSLLPVEEGIIHAFDSSGKYLPSQPIEGIQFTSFPSAISSSKDSLLGNFFVVNEEAAKFSEYSDINNSISHAISQVKNSLEDFLQEPDYLQKLQIPFGKQWQPETATTLIRDFVTGNYFPSIEIVDGTQLDSQGAFSQQTNTIYLAKSFLEANQYNVEKIVPVITEELGHYLDTQLNPSDSDGDEGKLFSLLVAGSNLTSQQIQDLKVENDFKNITLNGQTLLVEQSTNDIVGTSGRDNLVGTSGSDRITGGFAADTIFGGLGSDTFVYNNIRDAGDTIKDFELRTDVIDLTGVLNSFGYNRLNPIGDGYVQFSAYSKGTTILLDSDGIGSLTARPYITVENVTPNQLSSFPGHFLPRQTIPAPSINATLANDTGVSNSDRITLDPTVSGKTKDATSLQGNLNGNGFIDISNALNPDGSFTISLEQYEVLSKGSLPSGGYTLELKAGNNSQVFNTTTVSFTLDRNAAPISFKLAPESDTGVIGDNITNKYAVTLVGKTEPGLEVILVETQQKVTADINGNFSFANVTMPVAGEAPFTMVTVDKAGNQGRVQEFLTREGINSAPEITSNPKLIFDTQAERTYTYQLEATDPDGDKLTYSLINAPLRAEINSNGILSFAPLENLKPFYDFTVEVSDGRGGTDIQIFTVTTTITTPNINYAPIIISTPFNTASTSQNYTYDVNALDANGDSLTYSLLSAPTGMTIDQITGEIVWGTSTQRLGNYDISILVSDGRGATDVQNFVIGLTDIPWGEIRGTIWNDLNSNSLRDIEVVQGKERFIEPGMSGIKVYLDINNNGILDANEPTQITANDNPNTIDTDETGNYKFTRLEKGTYIVRQVVPANFIQTFPRGLAVGEGGVSVTNGSLNLIQPKQDIAATFVGRAGVSTDGLGTFSTGSIQAQIPAGSKVEYAFLHVATRTFDQPFRPTAIGFEDSSMAISWLDNVGDTLNFETGRVDVTSIVANKVDSRGGIYNFTVDELITGNAGFVEGTSLTVIYSNPSLPQRTIAILEGGLTGANAQTNILSLGSPIDKTDPNFIAQMALGIQYSDGGQQFSTVDVNGRRLTSSAGGADDGLRNNGVLVTVGGVGNSFANPINPSSNFANDDELYDLTPLLNNGDTFIRLDTANPSNDDSIFLIALTLPGTANAAQLNGSHLVELKPGEIANNRNFGNAKLNNPTPNQAPNIISEAPIFAQTNELFRYDPVAVDPDGDTLTFELAVKPDGMAIDANDGTIAWKPNQNQQGIFNVSLRVKDSLGASSRQNFQVIVGKDGSTPIITSNSPNSSLDIGNSFTYQVEAFDPNNDALTYRLNNPPTGMSIDGNGLLNWVPGAVGTFPVEIQVDDGKGGIATQRFELVINSPVVDTEAPQVNLGFNSSVLKVGETLNLKIQGFDNVGLADLDLSFNGNSLALTPDDTTNGFINTASLTLNQTGVFELVAKATDFAGNTSRKTQSIRVLDPTDNQSPIIKLDAPQLETTKLFVTAKGLASPEEFSFGISGSLDPITPKPGSPVTFTGRGGISTDGLGTNSTGLLKADIPNGSKVEHAYLHVVSRTFDQPFRPEAISFEGISLPITWLDNVQDTVTANDRNAGTGIRNFEVGRVDVTSLVAGKVGARGGIFEFEVDERITGNADFIEGTSLSVIYSNSSLPERTIVLLEGGLTQPDTRRTTISFASPIDTSSPDFKAQLALGISYSSLQNDQYTTIDVNGKRLSSSAGDLDDGFLTTLTDLAGASITVGGVGDSLSNPVNPLATKDFSDDELYDITSFLKNGDTSLTLETANSGNDDLLFLTALVLPASVTRVATQVPEPELGIINLNPAITDVTDITGTVSDSNLEFYRVEIAPLSLIDINNPAAIDPDYITIAQGRGNVNNGVLAQIDPNLYRNDTYYVRVYAQDINGKINVQGLILDINSQNNSQNKPGEFSLDFTDLSIPLTGIPIEITRSYSSLDANFQGDFGYGWELGMQDAGITEASPTGADLTVDDFIGGNSFTVGTRVTLNTPDGRRVGFTFAPVIDGVGLLGARWKPYFRPDPGVYETLEVPDFPLSLYSDGSTGLYLFGFTYNPSDYTLITKDGTKYNYNQYQGLKTVVDRNSNTLTFTDDGITSSTGVEIDFIRDAQGRIVEIIDPDGKSLKYSYDANGNLIEFSDRTSNETTFKYEGDRPHYLTEIIDPLGRTGVRTEYDEKGQISKIFDADGNALDINYNSAASRQTVKDPFGNTTTYVFDERGNVASEVDALGGVTARTYDRNNNVISETDPEGNITSYTYDSRGNKLTETNGEGNTTRFTYNANNDLLTETDPLGNTTTYNYDAKGNLTSRRDAAGKVTTYNYNQFGLLTEVIDANSNRSNFTYDVFGNITALTDPTGVKTSFTYDRNGRVTSITDALGGITNYIYDAQGRLIEKADPEGSSCGCARGITKTEYNAAGEKIAEIDALGRRTEYRYNERGLLIETILPDETPANLADNPRTKNEYDALDRLIATIDELGRKTLYIYDKLGRQIEVIYPDSTPNDLTNNPRTKKVYDKAGLVIAEIDELGNRTEFDYDKADRLTVRTNALGEVTAYIYDADGRQIAMTDGLGRTTNYAYDGLDRLISTTYANNTVMAMTYDSLGRIVAETDLAGNTTKYEYDALGRLTAVVDALNQRTEYKYDAVGNLIEQKDANGNITKFEYDSLRQRKAMILPGGQRNETIHDKIGNLIRVTDFNGATTTYEYNARNWLTEKSFSDGTSTENFAYTLTGELASVTDNRGVTNYSYDERDRLLSRTEPDNRQITYTYDAAGNILSLTVPSGATKYTYDALNRIDTVIDPDGGITDYSYDAVSNLIKTQFANGVTENQQYDLLNRLTYLENRNQTGIISSYSYTLDAMGNRTKVVEHDGRVVDYSYDKLYRLIQEKITDAVAGNKTSQYKFDPVGNRLERIDSVEGTTTYSYDKNDRLIEEALGGKVTQYQYDKNGNLTAQIENGQTQAQYKWNTKGELIAVETTENGETGRVEFEYDHEGIRVAIKIDGEETRFLIDNNQQQYAQVIEEYQTNGTVQASYVHGWDLISQEDANGRIYYQVDGLGTTRQLTNNNGLVIQEYDYDAYGNLTRKVGDESNSYLFAGEQFDDAVDGYYLRARYYDPATGRFVSRDPFEGFNNQPVTLHDYLYTGNNPVLYIDPSGESFIEKAVMYTLKAGILSAAINVSVTVGCKYPNVSGKEIYEEAALGFIAVPALVLSLIQTAGALLNSGSYSNNSSLYKTITTIIFDLGGALVNEAEVIFTVLRKCNNIDARNLVVNFVRKLNG